MGMSYAKAQKYGYDKKSEHSDLTSEDRNEDINVQSRAKVQNIFIDGIAKTEDKLMTKQLENLFTADTFERVIEEAHLGKLRLERLGILQGSEVFIDVSRGEKADPNGLDIYYLVKEKKTLSASTGTEVGNNEGSLSFSCNVNNIRGKGGVFNASASYGTSSTSSYQLSFSKPLFRNPDIKFQINYYQKARDITTSSYRECLNGGGLNITVPSPIGFHSICWDGVWRENRALGALTPFTVREQFGHTLKSSLKHVFVSDGRDNSFFPTKGHLLKHTVEYAGLGGDTKFVKSEAELQVNKEIMENVVIGTTFQAGAMKSLSGQQTAINDRFFLGGPLSVRGFLLNGIGPRAQTSSLGADAFWAAGLHLYTPLPFKPGHGGFGDLFRTHIFASAGNLCNIDLASPSSDVLKSTLSNVRWSYGLGMIFLLGGIARLEVNYCIPNGCRPGDGLNPGLQIGIGMNFL